MYTSNKSGIYQVQLKYDDHRIGDGVRLLEGVSALILRVKDSAGSVLLTVIELDELFLAWPDEGKNIRQIFDRLRFDSAENVSMLGELEEFRLLRWDGQKTPIWFNF